MVNDGLELKQDQSTYFLGGLWVDGGVPVTVATPGPLSHS